MAKTQLNARVSDLTRRQLDELGKRWGTTQTETLTVIIDRMYQQEAKIMSRTSATYSHRNGETQQPTVAGIYIIEFNDGKKMTMRLDSQSLITSYVPNEPRFYGPLPADGAVALVQLTGKTDPTLPDAMSMFPLSEDQYIEEDGATSVIVHLADKDDLAAAQEQYLNTNPQVIRYEVVA